MHVIAHGVDLVEIARVSTMLEEHGRRFTHRCFTPEEREYADAGRRRRAERYAARFACKEAVMKALGTGWARGIRWTDIGVVSAASGRPELVLRGRAGEIAAELGVDGWLVSVSHAGPGRAGRDRATGERRRAAAKAEAEGGYALASVLAVAGRSPVAGPKVIE